MIQIVAAQSEAFGRRMAAHRARSGGADSAVEATVCEILENVRQSGDQAVRLYTQKFDGNCPDVFEIDASALKLAYEQSDETFRAALLRAAENITCFHRRQKREGFIDAQPNGVLLGQRLRPLARVGLYVPGGTAAYPSSVLMNALPAKIAGVGELIMVTPPMKDGNANPDILTAAYIAGVDRVFLAGGAQAVAALAYGTQSFPRVDKIVGPGNIYVATAKKLVYGQVDIDMVAGPSEILILADKTANPRLAAADMLGQAEHDALASAILVTTDQSLAQAVAQELEEQLQRLTRSEIAKKAIENFGMIVVCESIEQAVSIANEFAPEHLEVLLENPLDYLGALENAGSVFLGSYAPEALGDYFAGPNHVLPTNGTARFFSPLSVDSFVKRSSFIYYTKEALEQVRDGIVTIAEREGLSAHARSVQMRFENDTQ